MVNKSQDTLNQIFSALSDPTRRAIIARLAQGEASVGELAEPFAMSPPAISKHLRVLDGAGLLKRRVEGRNHHLSLNPEALRPASQWLAVYEHFWDKSFDALAALVEADEDKDS